MHSNCCGRLVLPAMRALLRVAV